MIEIKSKYQLTGNIAVLLIAASPYIFYSYLSLPESPQWETSFFVYNSNYYENVLVAFWTFMGKIVPLYLLIIWFMTCRHWWYHVILIPIGMYVFQLVTAIQEDLSNDVYEFWYILPFMLVIIPLIYLVRIKLFGSLHNISKEELERELTTRRTVWDSFKDLFR